ncbi:MAG: hypothetical protein IKP05_03930 [Alphaproteobacteria bacterium]|nr:hypothetical protein [Alphaproteobacteria bacterium]
MQYRISDKTADKLVDLTTKTLHNDIWSLRFVCHESPFGRQCLVYPEKHNPSFYVRHYKSDKGKGADYIEIHLNIAQQVDNCITSGVLLSTSDINYYTKPYAIVSEATYQKLVNDILAIKQIQKQVSHVKRYHARWINERFSRVY